MLALQMLYFVIERHWQDLFLDVQADLLSQLLSLTKDSDLDVQQWTFVCLASICMKRRVAGISKAERVNTVNGGIAILDRAGDEQGIWQETWTTALRRMNLASGAACRSACLMAHALMVSGFVIEASISTALASFFEEIITQGPAQTTDAVCAFIKVALEYAERDTKLYRLDHHQKVMVWFRYNWRIAQEIRSGLTTVSAILAPETIDLLAKIAGSSDTPTIWVETPVVVSDVFQHMTEELEISPIRNYLLYAVLPVEHTSRLMDCSLPTEPKLNDLEHMTTRLNMSRARQILDLLHDTFKDILATIDLGSATKTKNVTDICVFAALLLGVLKDAQEEPEHIAVETVCDLFERVLAQVLEEASYGVQERAGIMSSFVPILGQPGLGRVQNDRSGMWPMLTIPDVRAGITTLLEVNPPEASEPVDHSQADRLLAAVWQSTRVSLLVVRVSM